MSQFGLNLSARQIAGILAAISVAALTAFLRPELVGLAKPQSPTIQVAPISPIAGIAAPAKKSPLQAGEQIRSTPALLDPVSELCKGADCRTLKNTPTEAWEQTAVPAIDKVVEER